MKYLKYLKEKEAWVYSQEEYDKLSVQEKENLKAVSDEYFDSIKYDKTILEKWYKFNSYGTTYVWDNTIVYPTDEEIWQMTLKSWASLSADELKSQLFQNLLYKFKGDDIRNGYDETRHLCPLVKKGLVRYFTVDGAKEVYIQYLGDDDEYSAQALRKANEGKAYIRKVVDEYEARKMR